MSRMRFDDLKQYSDVLRTRDGEAVTMRFVEPRDGEELQNYYRSLSQRSRYNRFLGAMSELPKTLLERFTHVGEREGFTVVGDRRRHGLYEVVDSLKSGGHDGLAQSLETPHIQHDVVIHQKNSAGAVIASIANVVQNAVERISEEIPSAHLDDRAEAAIVGAAPRSFYDVDLPPQKCVANKNSRVPLGQLDFSILQPVRGTSLCMHPRIALRKRQAADILESRAALDRAQQFAERDFAFASYQDVDA